jgi:hypothetical protein
MVFLSRIRRAFVWKPAAAVVALGVVTGIGWILWMHGPGHKITDQELLREAVAEWKRAGEPGYGPNYQIFEQQAAQGYYDDAATTGRLFKRADDVQWSVVELAKIRTENGDIEGAKDQIKPFAGSDSGTRALRIIAMIQAHNGDFRGALETLGQQGDPDEVRLVFSRRQIADGNFDGALTTSEEMDSKSAGQVFYEVGDALRERGEQKRVRELASRMHDRKRAALFADLARFTSQPGEIHTIQMTPCDGVFLDANAGRFAEAEALIERNKCSYVSFVAIQQYAVDPAGAERLLRQHANPQDLAYGLGRLGEAAAKKGNIVEAFRFLENRTSFTRKENAENPVVAAARNTELVHVIARSWTIRDGPKPVLKWVRSIQNTDERTWALIGTAEALGHSRAQR